MSICASRPRPRGPRWRAGSKPRGRCWSSSCADAHFRAASQSRATCRGTKGWGNTAPTCPPPPPLTQPGAPSGWAPRGWAGRGGEGRGPSRGLSGGPRGTGSVESRKIALTCLATRRLGKMRASAILRFGDSVIPRDQRVSLTGPGQFRAAHIAGVTQLLTPATHFPCHYPTGKQFNLDSTHQEDQVTSKERNTGNTETSLARLHR